MKNIFNLMKTSHSDGDYDEEPLTDCCDAPFAHPDLDICSKCHEHASSEEWEDSMKEDDEAVGDESNEPKYKMKDLVQGRDREDNVVVTGEVIEVHTFDDRSTIYAIQPLGTDDRHIFVEDKVSPASSDHGLADYMGGDYPDFPQDSDKVSPYVKDFLSQLQEDPFQDEQGE